MGTATVARKDDTSIESPIVPSVVKYTFRHAPQPTSEEQLLWRLVAARAVLDACGVTGYGPSMLKRHIAAIIDSQRWFRQSWDDARLVFDQAGVEIEGVREAMSEFHLDSRNKVVRIPKERSTRVADHQTEWARAGAC